MAGYLSVSKAAKLVGVSRTEIQDKIRSGSIQTFEGQVALDNLQSVYPRAPLEDNSDVDRMQRYKAHAIDKSALNAMTDENALRTEIFRLRHELDRTTEQLQVYRRITKEIKTRLVSMQADCTQRQKLVLRALLEWISLQIRHARK